MNNQDKHQEEIELIRLLNRNLMQDLETYRDQNLYLKFQISELKKELNKQKLLLKYAGDSLLEMAASTRNEAIESLRESYHENYTN